MTASSVRTTDVVAEVEPSQKVEDSATAGEEVDKGELNVESTLKEETASGGVAPQHGLDEEQDIPLSLSTMGGEHAAVLRHSILIRDPQSKLAQADLEVFNAVGDAASREF
ncbi:unnamed protein product [Dibothriocephalus latus]|uniref:Uncharacterized protein n=1 Tax=Dibothriocephalus latus TaxID=60516 RepID=A0A3P6PYG3_DIBLA|nr:unnamed protein product [Dibothriocephalus latus]